MQNLFGRTSLIFHKKFYISETPEKSLDYLQIKTLGPYAKWEHTYTFAQNGDTATDLSKIAINLLQYPLIFV